MKKWEVLQVSGNRGWHCHTRYTDGRNTVAEMCGQASRNGLELIAFTEHVRKSLFYDFDRLVNDVKRARKRYPSLKILVGCEAKVLNRKGELDVSGEILKKCDIVLGTFHSFPSLNEGGGKKEGGMENEGVRKRLPAEIHLQASSRLPSTSGKEDLESALASVLKNPDVDIWTHPITFFERCPLCEKDVCAIINLCRKNNTLIENNIRPRYKSPRLIEACRKMGARIVTASDAHGIEDIRVLKPENKNKGSKYK